MMVKSKREKGNGGERKGERKREEVTEIKGYVMQERKGKRGEVECALYREYSCDSMYQKSSKYIHFKNFKAHICSET